MACLLDKMCTIIGVFYKYAKQRGDCSALTRKEMKTLLQEEFAGVIKNPRDPETLEMTFQLLDINKDDLVDFNEYLFLIFRVAKACHCHLQPRERHIQQGRARRAQHEGDLRGEGRDHRQLREAESEGSYACERQDSDHSRRRQLEATTRGEGRRDRFPQEPVTQPDQRSRQARDQELRDDCGRDRALRETQEWKDDCDDWPRGSDEQGEVETHQRQSRECESRRDEAGRHQRRQREPSREEGHQRQSRERDYDPRDCLPRSPLSQGGGDRQQRSQEATRRGGDERRHQQQETECQMEEEEDLRRPCVSGRQVDEESRSRRCAAQGIRSRSSCESQELEDRRREYYPHEVERRSGGRHQHVADECQDQRCDRKPVDCGDECHSFPREEERRSRSRDPEREQRRSQRCDAGHTERSMSDRRVGERGSQCQYPPRSREAELRESDIRESEQRRRQAVDQDEWTRPHPCEPSTRAEVENQQWSRDPECRERQQSGLHPYECKPTDGERRRPQFCGSEPREGDRRQSQRCAQTPEEDDWRREQYHQDEAQEEENQRRRRPLSGDHESRRPQRREQEQRGSQRRQQYSDPEPSDTDLDRRLPETQEAAQREGRQERQQHYDSETLESVSRRRRPQSCYSESWEGERRRPEQANFSDDERERSQSRQSISRPREQDSCYPSVGGRRECDGGRRQGYESESWETERRSHQLREPEDYEERRQRYCEPGAREHDESRPQRARDTDPTGVDGRRSQTWEVDPRDGEQQRRSRCCDSERSQTPRCDGEARQDEQRRNQSQDVDQRDGEQCRTQSCTADVGDVEHRRRGMDPRISEQQRRGPSRSSGGADANQRRIQAREDDPRESQRRRALPPGSGNGASQQRRSHRCDSESREREHYRQDEECSLESRAGNQCVFKPRQTKPCAFSCN